jgi:hypothetical protein
VPTRLLLAVLFAMLPGCGEKAPPFEKVTLPSGRVIRQQSYMPESLFTGEQALVLKFFPDAKLDDAPALDAEVAAVWKDFMPHAQQVEAELFLIRALPYPTDGWDPGRPVQYVYRRQADGSWSMERDPELRVH